MKQIDEMTEIIGALRFHNTSDYIAERLYNAGYRKESEVAEKIFAEIDDMLSKAVSVSSEGLSKAIVKRDSIGILVSESATALLGTIRIAFTELKKKYTEGENDRA